MGTLCVIQGFQIQVINSCLHASMIYVSKLRGVHVLYNHDTVSKIVEKKLSNKHFPS